VIPLAEIRFYDVVVFIHVAAAVVAFGATFAYPFFQAVVERVSPRSVPAMFRAMSTTDRTLVIPGALVVLAAGLYLVITEDGGFDFGQLFVQVGMVIIIVLLILGLTFFRIHEHRALELAERNIAAAGQGEVEFSDEYWAVSRRMQQVGGLAGLMIVVAVFFMTVKP
jgi:hypothetical protein